MGKQFSRKLSKVYPTLWAVQGEFYFYFFPGDENIYELRPP